MDTTPRSIGVLSLLWISAVAAPVIGGPGAALAATILVNDLTESGPGCTLRKAIASADANADVAPCAHTGAYGDDVIELTPGTYSLSTADNAPNAFPVVTSAITIVGKGSIIARTNGDASPHFRFFRVNSGHLKLLDLTLSGGLITNATGEREGGAIRVVGDASLTLASVTLTGNRVIRTDQTTARGGAVSFVRGALTIMDTSLLNNSATSSGPEFGGGTALGGGVSIETDSGTPIFPALVDVIFQGNRVSADGTAGGAARGGGLFFEGLGALSMTRATFRNNSATANGNLGPGGAARGGAIYFQGDEGSAILQLASAVVQENLASATTVGGDSAGSAAGGGVYVNAGLGVLGVRDSTFSQNLVSANANNGANGGLGRGGAIYVEATGLDGVLISRSGIAGNTVISNGGNSPGGNGGAAQGGGIFFQGASGGLTLTDVTVTGNAMSASAATDVGGAAQGGGVYFSSDGVLALVHATVAANSVTAVGTSPGAAQGGGIFLASAATIQNSIFSDNTAATGPNCSGSTTSLGNNLFANGGACGANGTDKVGVTAALGALADTGRPGGLHRPLGATSQAIDGANPAACPPIDQLGRGRVGACDIGAVEFAPGSVPTTTLVAAVLPASRAGVAGSILTAFVTIINAGTVPAYQVGIGLGAGSSPALLTYQTTDPGTNLPTGLPNTPVDIAPSSAQTYVIALLLTGAFDPTDLVLLFAGTNTLAVPAVVGLNTFLASAATTAIADVVALAATIGNTGIVDVAAPSSAGVFSIATVNLGAADAISAVSSTGSATLPLAILICETDAGGVCKAPPAVSVSLPVATNATPTFAVFVTGLGAVPFDPAGNRIFILFVDSASRVRGGTSVAVRTTP